MSPMRQRRVRRPEMAKTQHHLRLSALSWIKWRQILMATWQSSGENNVTLVAAGVAFYAFLAFVPLLAAMVLVFGIVADQAILAASITKMVQIMPPGAATVVTDQLQAIVAQSGSQKGVRLLVAILLSVFGAMRAASAIVMALNIAYEVTETRSFIRVNLMALTLTLGFMAALIALAVVISMLGIWDGWLSQLPLWAETILRLTMLAGAVLAVTAVIATIYRYAPNRPKSRWSWITPGSAIATVGALSTVVLFALYVAHLSDYTATYGALGAIIVLLMWFWLTSLSLCVGAEINAHIERLFAD
jgi:membrane protein